MIQKSRDLAAFPILVIATILLLAGHFVLQQYGPNTIVRAGSFIFLMAVSSYVVLIRRDIFAFVMTIYVASHFSYGDNHGGLWNLLAVVVVSIFFPFIYNNVSVRGGSILIRGLLGIFILSNVAGWVIVNPLPLESLVKGIAAFFGYMLIFYLSSNISITKERVKIYISIVTVLIIYQFIISIFQYYQLADWSSPIVGGNTLGTMVVTEVNRPVGTIQHFELFAEYAVLMSCLLVPMLSSSTTKKELRLSYLQIIAVLIVCCGIVIITSVRAAAILMVLTIVLYYLLLVSRFIKSLDKISQQLKLAMIFMVVFPVASIYVGYKELKDDFNNVDIENITIQNVISGKAINRGPLIVAALNRIESESWILGFGSGTIQSNQWAWFGYDPERRRPPAAGYHNLYLSIIMVYGWIGAFAFLGIVLTIVFKLLVICIKNRRNKSYLVILALGMGIMWCIFLIDEYKISILRNSNYQMIIWILLGLSYSLTKSFNKQSSYFEK